MCTNDDELLSAVQSELLWLAMSLPVEWIRQSWRFDERLLPHDKRLAYIQEHIRELDGLTDEQRENLTTIMRLPFDRIYPFLTDRMPPRFDGLTLRQILEILE